MPVRTNSATRVIMVLMAIVASTGFITVVVNNIHEKNIIEGVSNIFMILVGYVYGKHSQTPDSPLSSKTQENEPPTV